MHCQLRLITVFFVFIILLQSACKDKDLDLTPSYIEIEHIQVNTTSAQGTDSQRITDAWVYLNNDIQGTYQLPARFPVLAEGLRSVTIRPGIMSNGISATRIFYPFLEAITFDIDFKRDSTYTFNLTANYHPQVVFKWLENFEDGGISLQRTIKSDADIVKTSAIGEVFEGNYSAKAVLDSNRYLFECYTIDAFQLPKGGAPVFLEMNYKNNAKVHIGIYAYTQGEIIQRSVLVLNESDVWKKIYVNLTNAVSENFNAYEYRVFFGMLRYEDDNFIPTAYFDNIKLIHF